MIDIKTQNLPIDSLDMIESSLLKLQNWLDNNGWEGFDPYDALNSELICKLSCNKKILKIIYTQALKRISWNIRSLLKMNPSINPKGMGLFASSYIELFRSTKEKNFLDKAIFCLDWLENNCSAEFSGRCWGYNFDWQSRGFFLPKNTPTIVNTSFISNAFLDAYELFNEKKYLDIAESSCNFIINDLNTTKEGESICFSYTPIDKTQVYNASLLGAYLLARVYSHTKDKYLLEIADKAVNFVINHQNPDGSWYYGNAPFYRWIDGYHSAFVLEYLNDYINISENFDLMPMLKKGMEYYKENLFTNNYIPKFRNNSLYPIDIHCCASAIITFTKLKHLHDDNLLWGYKVFNWTVKNMQDKDGFFYFQKHKFFTNKIPYIRWGQAWMLRAISILLNEVLNKN